MDFPKRKTTWLKGDNYSINEFISLYGITMENILNGVKNNLVKQNGLKNIDEVDMIAGLYFGREDPNNLHNDTVNFSADLMYQNMLTMSKLAHQNGDAILWIPYITNEQDYENIGLVGNHSTYVDKNGNIQNLIDIILLQPGYFYPEIGADQSEYFAQKMQDIYDSILCQKIIAGGQEIGGEGIYNTTKIGLQFEFDMGMITGRLYGGQVPSRDTDAKTKIQNFSEYIRMYYNLVKGNVDGNKKPFGMYAGGPNEMNLSNTSGVNTMYHGTNHLTYYANYGERNNVGNGMRYSDFSLHGAPTYDGNLIYDIMNGLINDKWSGNLLNFIYDYGEIGEMLPIPVR